MKRFLLLPLLTLAACDSDDESLTFEAACERLVAECSVPATNLGNCKNHGWEITEAVQEAGCEEDLDNFLHCANESDLFCGAFAGAVCEMEAEVLAACGAPLY